VRGQRSVHVLASGLDVDLHAGQIVRGLRDEPRRLLVDITRDPDEIERRPRIAIDRGVDVRRGHMEERRKTVDDNRPLNERQVGRSKLDDERWHVRDERPAVPVVDHATRRDDRLEHRAVSNGLRGEGVALHDLHVEQPSRETGHRDDRDQREHQEPGEALDVARPFVEEDAHQSIRSVSIRRSWIDTASGPIRAASTVS
jgi:hypothetical protein